MSKERHLTDTETKILRLLKSLEQILDKHQITARATMSVRALEILKETTSIKVISAQLDNSGNNFNIVMHTSEFMRYIHYVIRLAGLTLMVDGSLKTSDDLVIANDYLGEV